MDARRVSSVVFQDPVLDRPLTGRQNLQLHLRLWRVPKADGLARLAELTAAVGLAGLLDRPVATYSGGQRRRLEIVRALLSAPGVLFLDEPTVGLDTRIRHDLFDTITALRERTGVTVLLTTHYLDEAERLCDRLAIIDGGRIVACDTPEQAVQHLLRRPPGRAVPGGRAASPARLGLRGRLRGVLHDRDGVDRRVQRGADRQRAAHLPRTRGRLGPAAAAHFAARQRLCAGQGHRFDGHHHPVSGDRPGPRALLRRRPPGGLGMAGHRGRHLARRPHLRRPGGGDRLPVHAGHGPARGHAGVLRDVDPGWPVVRAGRLDAENRAGPAHLPDHQDRHRPDQRRHHIDDVHRDHPGLARRVHPARRTRPCAAPPRRCEAASGMGTPPISRPRARRAGGQVA
jgi:energy-coupling factor transporter ATP-binding protein EcfA2